MCSCQENHLSHWDWRLSPITDLPTFCQLDGHPWIESTLMECTRNVHKMTLSLRDFFRIYGEDVLGAGSLLLPYNIASLDLQYNPKNFQEDTLSCPHLETQAQPQPNAQIHSQAFLDQQTPWVYLHLKIPWFELLYRLQDTKSQNKEKKRRTESIQLSFPLSISITLLLER